MNDQVITSLSAEVTTSEDLHSRITALSVEYKIAMRDKDYKLAMQISNIGLALCAAMSNFAFLGLQVQQQHQAQVA